MITAAPRPANHAPRPESPPAGPPPRLGNVLRALVRKEVRQNLPFAAIMILVVIVALLAGQSHHTGENILLDPGIGDCVTIVCILAALCLGLVQPLFDRNFDVWAFLVHRPVSRSVLFAGRALAGLFLYTCAVGLPLLGLFLYAISPYGRGIFLWQYLLPPIADFFAAIPFYFAGLLAADRSARLYGSRAIPIAAAIGAALFAHDVPWFSLAIASSLVVAAVFALAAEGSVISHGYTLRALRLGRLAATAILLLSFTLILMPISDIGLQKARFLHESAFPAPTPIQTAYTTTSRTLFDDATIGIVTTELTRDPTGWRPEQFTMKSQRYTDLQGHLLVNPKLADDAKNNHSFSIAARSSFPPQSALGYRDIQDLARRFESEANTPDLTLRWYWVNADRIFYVYQVRKDRSGSAVGPPQLLGTLGISGFAKPGTRAEPFIPDANARDWPRVTTSRALYVIDPKQFTLRTLFTAPAGETLLQALREHNDKDQLENNANFFIITDKHIFRTAPDGRILQQIPLTHDLNAFRLSSNYFPVQHRWVLHYTTIQFWRPRTWLEPYPSNSFSDSPNIWETYDDAGALLSTASFPTRDESTPTLDYTSPPPDLHKLHQSALIGGFALGISNPLLVLSTHELYRPLTDRYRYVDPSDPTFFTMLRPTEALLPFLATLIVLSLITFGLSFLYRLPHRWLWPLLALLCGPAAILTLIAANTLPRRTRCPACRHKRPLDQPLCPHCNAPFPTPPQTGTEIFSSHATLAALHGSPA